MGTAQLLMTIGAMFILSLIILRVNNTFLSTSTVLLDNKFGVLAVSLATSMIEEATGKAFDSKSDTSAVTALTQLSIIGKETGEVYPNFDDVDDYNGFVKRFTFSEDSSFVSANYSVSCVVSFVLPTNPDLAVTQKTWHKKISVTVTSESMSDTVRMSTIYSYWFYR